MHRVLLSIGLTVLVACAAHVGATVYTNDFSTSAGSEWSNNTISTDNGEKFLASNADGFGNGTAHPDARRPWRCTSSVTLSTSTSTPSSRGMETGPMAAGPTISGWPPTARASS